MPGLICVIYTKGRIHGEFEELRLILYVSIQCMIYQDIGKHFSVLQEGRI